MPVAALRTEQCLRSAGTAVLRSHWQQQLRQGFVESSCESRQQGPALCAKLGPSEQYGLPGLPMALPLGELASSEAQMTERARTLTGCRNPELSPQVTERVRTLTGRTSQFPG